jgi:predicted ATPase
MDYVGLVLGACGGLIGVGTAFVRLRSETDTESARLWKENAEAEKTRADRLEATVRDLTARVERLEVENGMLRSLVTGERALDDLSSLITSQHAQVMEALRGPSGPVRAVETRGDTSAPDKDSRAS